VERFPTEAKLFPDPTPIMAPIIQLNCPGFKINFIEITILVQTLLPIASCLQETHLTNSYNITMQNYSEYITYVDEDERADGGSTFLARDRHNILHSYVNIDTDLQAVSVHIYFDKTITLCSVNIPPNSSLSVVQLKN
jgi:hypothetical protein